MNWSASRDGLLGGGSCVRAPRPEDGESPPDTPDEDAVLTFEPFFRPVAYG